MIVSRTIRHRLEVQGFCNLDDAAMNELAPWLRWSPALCTTVLGLILGVALLAVALLVSVTHTCIPSMIYNALFSRRAVLAPKRPDATA